MTINGIKSNVQALLEETDYFVSVLPHAPKEDTTFNGFPSVCHYYDNTDPDYATVSQNRRVIQYTIELYFNDTTGTDPVQQYDEIYATVDDTIQMLDESVDLSEGLGKTITPNLPHVCDFMRPAPGELVPVITPEGTALMCTIRLFCGADVSFR
jgi:hypothetical protein